MTCTGRHWFAYPGYVGSSSPTCTRYGCDEPNKRYDVNADPYAGTPRTETGQPDVVAALRESVERIQWAVLWAHASSMTMDPEKVLSDYPGDEPFTGWRLAQEWAGPIARAGGFVYTLVRRTSDGWVTRDGTPALEALRSFKETGRWPAPRRTSTRHVDRPIETVHLPGDQP